MHRKKNDFLFVNSLIMSKFKQFISKVICYKTLSGINTERLGVQLSQARDMFHEIERQNAETMEMRSFS